MELNKAIANRHATRWFTDQAIPSETLEKIVSLAQLTPSWVNSQPVRVRIVTGEKLAAIRSKHAVLNQDGAQTDPVLPFRPKSEWDKPAQENMEAWYEGNFTQVGADWSLMVGQASNQLYNAQAVAYLTLAKDFSDWSLIDLGAFTQSLMLAATDQGVATLPAYEFTKYNQVLREELDLPASQELIYGIGLGYADDSAAINKIDSARMDLSDVVTFMNH